MLLFSQCGYPRSMSMTNNVMHIANKTGQIHIYSFEAELGRLTFIEVRVDITYLLMAQFATKRGKNFPYSFIMKYQRIMNHTE